MKKQIFKVCVLGLVAVTLVTGCTSKEGKIIKIKKGEDTITISKEASNSNEPIIEVDIHDEDDSNIIVEESNKTSNTTKTSNVSTKNLKYDIKNTKGSNKESAVVSATSNGKTVWQYKTATYDSTGWEMFTLYEGKKYVYLAEVGTIKALNKTTGKVEWKTSKNYGQNISMIEDGNTLVLAPCYKHQSEIYVLYTSGKEMTPVSPIDLQYYDQIKITGVSKNTYELYVHKDAETGFINIEYNYQTGRITEKTNKSNKQKLTITSMNGDGEKVVYEVDKYARQLDGAAGYNNVYYFINDGDLYYVSPAEPSKKVLVAHDAIDVLYDMDLGFVGVIDKDASAVINKTESDKKDYNSAMSRITILKVNNDSKLTVRSMDDGSEKTFNVDSYAIPNEGAAGLSNNSYYIKNNALYYVEASGDMTPIKIATGVKYVSFSDTDNHSGFIAVADTNFKYVNENSAYLLKVINK